LKYIATFFEFADLIAATTSSNVSAKETKLKNEHKKSNPVFILMSDKKHFDNIENHATMQITKKCQIVSVSNIKLLMITFAK
jgi:hypothetical protein